MTVAPAAERFNRSEWASAFRNVEQELTDVALQPARGEVPSELLGTLYRNGPGPVSYTHLTLPTILLV